MRTRFTELIGVEHPVASAVSEAAALESSAWIGQSAGLIDEIKPAAEIVREIVAEAEACLHALGQPDDVALGIREESDRHLR